MDNQDIAALIPAAHNANVGVLRVEYQVARLGLGPCNRCTVGVLGAGTPAVAYGVGPIGDVVKYPVYKTGTVEAIGKICSAGGVASRPNLLDRPPAAVPANYPAFAAPKVVDFPHCQRQYEIVRKRRRNFVVFRRGGNKTKKLYQ